MNVRLVIPESIERDVRALLLRDAPLESGAALCLGLARLDDGVALLVRKIILPPPGAFRIQREAQWAPTPAWLSRLAGTADEENCGIGLIHSHPMTRYASRSDADQWADELVAPFFTANLGDRPFASLVLTSDEIAGAVWLDGVEHEIAEVRIPGPALRRSKIASTNVDDALFDRQELIFGRDGQLQLAALRVAVIGLGGTGSAVAEQLCRLGVGELLIVDFDAVDHSNVSRVYGSNIGDLGKPKVGVVGRSLASTGIKTRIVEISGDIRNRETASRIIRRADLILGCTDSHSSRAVLNDIAYQYFIPLIDMGIRVGIGEHGPTSAAIEVRVVRPDLPCLWCQDVLDGRRVAEELMPADRRTALEREGYVQRGGPAATIIPYTSLAASLSASRFLAMATALSEYEVGTYVFDALTFDGWQRSTSTRPDCVCLSRLGLGDARPVWLREGA